MSDLLGIPGDVLLFVILRVLEGGLGGPGIARHAALGPPLVPRHF
jgi:hypothetical protein